MRLSECGWADIESRDAEEFKPIHVVNLETTDNDEDAQKKAKALLTLCKLVNDTQQVLRFRLPYWDLCFTITMTMGTTFEVLPTISNVNSSLFHSLGRSDTFAAIAVKRNVD